MKKKVQLIREVKEKGEYLQLSSAISMYLIKHWHVYNKNIEPTVENFFKHYKYNNIKLWYISYFNHNCLKNNLN